MFIADEVITGGGRSGKNFGIDHWNILPDMIVMGKGLAGGYTPIAAVIASEKVIEAFTSGSGQHSQGFTYSGNPLSCAIANAVLTYVKDNALVERAARIGEYVKNKLEELREFPIIGDIRGKGLILGVELVRDVATKEPFPPEVGLTRRIVAAAFKRRLHIIGGMGGMIDGVRGDQLQITPAFVITEEQVDEAIGTMKSAFAEVLGELQ